MAPSSSPRPTKGVVGRELWAIFPGATAQKVGPGCCGTFAPRLSATDPAFASTLTVRGSRARPKTIALLFASVVRVHLTPVPGTGCSTGCTVAPDMSVSFVAFRLVDTKGGFAFTRTVPNLPGLSGMRIATQALLLPGAAIRGGELTNANQLTLGY